MYQRKEIIEQLGIESLSAEAQDEAVEVAIYRAGQAVTDGLSEQQLGEYESIINDNHDVIDAWLSNNVPEYKTLPAYQEFEAGYSEDPEKNNPAKLFATLAWIEKNVPDVEARTTKALAAYKQELAA